MPSDKEILDTVVGGITIRDMKAMGFLALIANKLDGAPAYKAATVELQSIIGGGYYGSMPELEKCRLVRKLFELDITL